MKSYLVKPTCQYRTIFAVLFFYIFSTTYVANASVPQGSNPKKSVDDRSRINLVQHVVTVDSPKIASHSIPQKPQTLGGLRDSVRALFMKMRTVHDKKAREEIRRQIDTLTRSKYRKNSSSPISKTSPQNKIRAQSIQSQSRYTDSSVNTYHVPFASENNRIELTITNRSSMTESNVRVSPEQAPPAWLRVTPRDGQFIEQLNPGGGVDVAIFQFSVDKTAPVGKENLLSFSVRGSNGDTWSKKMKIIVDAPREYKLEQNYPNPFNPTTTIGYILPEESKVALKLYDVLGNEVATIVQDVEEAGYHSVEWNALRAASGMYFYRFVTASVAQPGKNVSQIKKMLYLK